MESLYMYLAWKSGGFAVVDCQHVKQILMITAQHVADGWAVFTKDPEQEKWQTSDIVGLVAILSDIDNGWERVMLCEPGANPQEAYKSYLLQIQIVEWAEHLRATFGRDE